MVLMAVLYDSAARVQEIIDLKVKDLRLDKLAVITLHGKGQKLAMFQSRENQKICWNHIYDTVRVTTE
jgi:site-specific recombinase XerD